MTLCFRAYPSPRPPFNPHNLVAHESFLRRLASRLLSQDADVDDVVQQLAHREDRRRIVDAVLALPDPCRETPLLHYGKDLRDPPRPALVWLHETLNMREGLIDTHRTITVSLAQRERQPGTSCSARN